MIAVWTTFFRQLSVIRALEKRLASKVSIGSPVIRTTPIGGMTPTGFQIVGHAIYVQLPIKTKTEIPLSECHGYLQKISKLEGAEWKSLWDQSMPIYWSHTTVHPPQAITLRPGITFDLNVLKVTSLLQKIEPQVNEFGVPLGLPQIFIDPMDTFKFDVAVSPGDGVTAYSSLRFKLGAQWDKPEICKGEG